MIFLVSHNLWRICWLYTSKKLKTSCEQLQDKGYDIWGELCEKLLNKRFCTYKWY